MWETPFWVGLVPLEWCGPNQCLDEFQVTRAVVLLVLLRNMHVGDTK